MLQFMGRRNVEPQATTGLAGFLSGFSIEVMPRTAAKIEDFRGILPAGTRVYIAHIDGTPIDEMVATAKRLRDEGFEPMPHLPARSIAGAAILDEWVRRYRDEAGVAEALVLAGGAATPAGDLMSSMDMIATGVFEKYGFRRLHVAGHPEGNRDIDAEGGSTNADAALAWKQDYARRAGIDMAIVTQFAFDAAPVIAWAERLSAQGIDLPIHAGVAGPAKLQTLIKYALACGVGPSLKVLQKRAMDVSKLLLPYEPTGVLADLATWKAENPAGNIAAAHLFPLGGVAASADWAARQTSAKDAAA